MGTDFGGGGHRFRRAEVLQTVHLFDDEEDREGNDDEFEDRIEEETVGDHGLAGLLCICDRGDSLTGQIDVETGEVDFPEDDAERGHDDVIHERRDDLIKRGAHRETDSKVDHIAASGELSELVEEFFHEKEGGWEH